MRRGPARWHGPHTPPLAAAVLLCCSAHAGLRAAPAPGLPAPVPPVRPAALALRSVLRGGSSAAGSGGVRLRERRAGQRPRAGACTGVPVRPRGPDGPAGARDALDADADSEAAMGADGGAVPVPKSPPTRLGKGLLCHAPPSFASKRHVAAVDADLQQGGRPRAEALALLSGIAGEDGQQRAAESEDMLRHFGRSLVGIVLELTTEGAPSAAYRSDRLAAMRTLRVWLQQCRVGSRAAEDIMDGLTAALATMVLSDSSARQKERVGLPPLLAVPQ